MKKIEREKIILTHDELMDLWNGVYYIEREYNVKDETYSQVKKINTSDYSDGPSWDYILKRKSDGKFFKFNVWDAGGNNGYIFEDEYLIEVFEKIEITYE